MPIWSWRGLSGTLSIIRFGEAPPRLCNRSRGPTSIRAAISEPTANTGLENRRCKVLANAAERRTLPMARSSIMRHDVYSRRVDEVSTLPQGGGICTTAAAIMRLSHVRRSRPTWTTSMHTSSVPDWRHCLQPVIWCVMVRCLARTSTSLRRTRYPAAPVTVLIFPALAM